MYLEIECKVCKKKHYPKTLMRSLSCCPRATERTRLINAISDPALGTRWFVPTNAAIVRIFVGKRVES